MPVPSDPPRRTGPTPPRSEPAARESPSPRLEAIVDRIANVWGRMSPAWRALAPERRLAALAAFGLFVALFLPWYQETVIARGVTNLRSLSDTMTGWAAFSFVEAAVLVVAFGVLGLLFVRADGKAFHVPGGDGGVITTAGLWTCLLIVWRMFDKQGTTGHGLYTTTSGIEWGIFVALAIAGVLTYAGTRIRQAHEPEPPLPGERPSRATSPRRTRRAPSAAPRSSAARRSAAAPAATAPAAATVVDQVVPEGRRRRPRSIGRVGDLGRDLDLDLDLAEPPTASLRAGRGPARREPPTGAADEQLTLRLPRDD